MTSETERWIRVKQLFTDALALDPTERSSFLAGKCEGDELMRREVESLLSSHDEAGDRFERPASGAAALAAAGFGSDPSYLHLTTLAARLFKGRLPLDQALRASTIIVRSAWM